MKMGDRGWCSALVWLSFLLLSVAKAPGQSLLDLNFEGHYRDLPKTSIARADSTDTILPETHYANLNDLLDALPANDLMRQEYPDLNQKQAGFPETRKPEELRNVDVDCWIYALKFEDGRGTKKGDNDVHVILGSASTASQSVFMTAEISGLPASGENRTILEDARRMFLDMFQGQSPTSRFRKVSPPKRVTIKGSLFFDGDHQAGCVACPGPAWAKPKTVWEIHPVYGIAPTL